MEQEMKLTHKKAGIGLVGLAVLMLGTAAVADNMGGMGKMGGMGGHGMMSLDFATIDANKDGKISKDEITAARTAEVAAVDANKDGKLSAEELAQMQIKAMTAAANDMATRMIVQLDTDGDKLLSAAELAARPMPADMFDRIDTNHDGFIDQAEADAAKQAMMDGGPGHGEGDRDGRGHGKHGNDGNGGN
jgi:hypothetical protein